VASLPGHDANSLTLLAEKGLAFLKNK